MSSQRIIPEQLTYAEAAVLVGRSISWLEKKVRARMIPYHKIGHSVRFDRGELLRWMEEYLEKDSRIQQVHPLKKRPGVQYVYPSQQLGDFEHCWCGEPFDHDWPGKDKGKPHPHDHEGIQQVVVVRDEATNDRIERTSLRGYHATLRDFIVKAVNTDGLKHRVTKNEVILYPPDGSKPIAVHARNAEGQMRSLNQWYDAHVIPYLRVDQSTVQRLAEVVNDPAEHPFGHQTEEQPVEVPEQATEWIPYVHTDGEVSEWFETDGTIIRCKVCVGTDTAYETPMSETRGLGGHVRMAHRDVEALRSPEALAKSLDTKRYNRLRDQVAAAVELLADTIGEPVGSAAKRIEELERQNAAMAKEVAGLRGEMQGWKDRAEEAERKMATLKELFT